MLCNQNQFPDPVHPTLRTPRRDQKFHRPARALLFIVRCPGIVDNVMKPKRAFNRVRRFAFISYTVEFRETCFDVIAGVIAAMGLGIRGNNAPEGIPGQVLPAQSFQQIIPSLFVKHGISSCNRRIM